MLQLCPYAAQRDSLQDGMQLRFSRAHRPADCRFEAGVTATSSKDGASYIVSCPARPLASNFASPLDPPLL